MSDWRDGPLPFIILAAAILIGVGMGTGLVMLNPRIKSTLGFQLNNPGNVERGENWAGLSSHQKHARYATFIAPEFGIRVIAYLINKYARDYGLRTVRGIISRYAPTHENPTDTYIANVAAILGMTPNTIFDVHARMFPLVKAIIAQEIGYGENPYPDTIIAKGIAMATHPAETAQAVKNPASLPSGSVKFA